MVTHPCKLKTHFQKRVLLPPTHPPRKKDLIERFFLFPSSYVHTTLQRIWGGILSSFNHHCKSLWNLHQVLCKHLYANGLYIIRTFSKYRGLPLFTSWVCPHLYFLHRSFSGPVCMSWACLQVQTIHRHLSYRTALLLVNFFVYSNIFFLSLIFFF